MTLQDNNSGRKGKNPNKLFSYKSEEQLFDNKELDNFEINDHFNNNREEINKKFKKRVVINKLNTKYNKIMTKNLNKNKPFKCYRPQKINYMHTYNKQLHLINKISTCMLISRCKGQSEE